MSAQSLLPNADFTLGDDGKEGWTGYVNVFDTATMGWKYGFLSNTSPATPLGGGALELTMYEGWSDNGAGPLDLGDTIEYNFYVDFGAAPAFAGEEVTFTGNFVIGTAFDPSVEGIAFLKTLDTGWGLADFQVSDVSTADGSFSLTTTVPTEGINAFQVGFAMTGVAGSPGSMEVSNLSLTSGALAVVPEPSSLAWLVGCLALTFAVRRRR